jgi:hypothetical protein
MRLIVRFSPVIAALVLAMACGDDDDAPAAPVQCKSPYPDRTATELKLGATSTGKCAADTAAVCANDVISETSTCAQGCFAMYPSDAAMQGTCTLSCLKDGRLSPAPSDGCLSCYVASVGCTAKYCLMECLAGGAADLACTNCRVDAGCTADFYACSGLPLPLGTTPGTGGNGNGTGGDIGSGGAVSMGGAGGQGEAGMSTAGVGATSGGGGVPGESGGAGGAGPAGGGGASNAGAGG